MQFFVQSAVPGKEVRGSNGVRKTGRGGKRNKRRGKMKGLRKKSRETKGLGREKQEEVERNARSVQHPLADR